MRGKLYIISNMRVEMNECLSVGDSNGMKIWKWNDEIKNK